LLAVAAYAIALAALSLVEYALGRPLGEPGIGRFVGLTAIPLSLSAFYLLALFTFGFEGDLAARASMVPPRLFTLPITTSALVGWPMLYGTVSVALLAAAARLAPWPEGVHVQAWVPLFAAVVIAWAQVFIWTAYPIRGLRVILTTGWLIVMDFVLLLGHEFEPPAFLMSVILTPLLPLAYITARASVARARRGDVPEWRGLSRRRAPARSRGSDRRPFATPAAAQLWSEWRQHGWTLPVWVAFVLPFAAGLMFIAGDTPVFVLISLISMLVTPPLMATFVGAALGKASARGRDASGIPPFLATRPLTSAAIVMAKLRVALRSTLLAWVLVCVAVPLALVASDSLSLVVDRVRSVRDGIGTPRTVVITLLIVAWLMVSTWKRLVMSLYVGLSGRPWLMRAHITGTLALLTALVLASDWIHDNAGVVLWNVAPWIAGGMAVVKVAATGWASTRLERGGLLDARTLVGAATGWLIAVAAVYALLVWIAATPHVPRQALMLIAILIVPLTRISFAPLALAWDRHR